jgi:hypothetical protein
MKTYPTSDAKITRLNDKARLIHAASKARLNLTPEEIYERWRKYSSFFGSMWINPEPMELPEIADQLIDFNVQTHSIIDDE